MEPDIKLFPAIFVEASSKEILQIELGRTSTTLPLSAAVLQNSERHVIPQVSFQFINLHCNLIQKSTNFILSIFSSHQDWKSNV